MLFVFSEYHDHRNLHSFPTRRSSDLEKISISSAFAMATTVYGEASFPATPPASIQLVRPSSSIPPAINRSEEHTSELQSHSDLVCRLLLEKKKDIKNKERSATATARA